MQCVPVAKPLARIKPSARGYSVFGWFKRGVDTVAERELFYNSVDTFDNVKGGGALEIEKIPTTSMALIRSINSSPEKPLYLRIRSQANCHSCEVERPAN